MDRTLTVTLRGGPPWGFRLRGGKDTGSPLTIARVNSTSNAAHQGVQQGDTITSVNGHQVEDLTLAEAHQLVTNSGGALSLQLIRSTPDTDAMFKSSASIEVNNTVEGTAPCHSLTVVDGLAEEVSKAIGQIASDEAPSQHSSSTSTCSTTIVVSTGQKRISGDGRQPSILKSNVRVQGDSSKSQSSTSTGSETTVPSPLTDRRGWPATPVGPTFKAKATKAVWSPGQQPRDTATTENKKEKEADEEEEEGIAPVWQPFGGGLDEKPQFRKVQLETLAPSEEQKCEKRAQQSESSKQQTKPRASDASLQSSASPISSPSSPSTATPFTRVAGSSRLPPSQSPTITLLQKAREGQIPKGAVYIDERNHPKGDLIPKDAILIDRKTSVAGDKIHTDSYYAIPTHEITSSNSTVIKAPKYEGIGPTECGIPVGLRTAVKAEYASDWYKTMFRSLHRADSGPDAHLGGYMSEPEFNTPDYYQRQPKSATLDNRRKTDRSTSYNTDTWTIPRSTKSSDSNHYLPSSTRISDEIYRNQPRSIADYEPGHSSIADKEFQKFWDEFWESVGDLQQQFHPSNRLPAAYEHKWPRHSDGYESDSTLIRKTGRAHQHDPQQQKVWYREVQRGGDIPFIGLGKPAPEKPKELQVGPTRLASGARKIDSTLSVSTPASPHQYQETEVNIHYRSPIRNLEKEYIEEEELRKRQEDAMRKFYEEERYKKHLQQLAEMEMRRHSDFFTPSQKSPIPLNRYDNPFDLSSSPLSKTPEPRTLAKALFNFTAQTTRELSFNKGDIIYINKKIDKNWYEGEHHGMIGIFPINYVEIIPTESANLQPRKATEGQAKVKYNFRAQTPVELSLFKGEVVVLMRRVDKNWYEGRIGTKSGIFPSSYVEVTTEPGESVGIRDISPKPPASPVYTSRVVNGTHQKSSPSSNYNTGVSAFFKSPALVDLQQISTEERQPVTQSLHIDTYNEPIPYRALYQYCPQNEDELELHEGDTVYVMEKCDDGWYVGTSLRTGLFGTFPGNYVERI